MNIKQFESDRESRAKGKAMRLIGILTLLTVVAAPAMAQSPEVWQTYNNLLGSYPSASSALQADPSLYRSSAFMNQNPVLQSYILQHPDLYQSLMSHAPKYRPDSNAYALSSYLHYHPQVAQALEVNPALSTDPSFLQNHPQFRIFLRNHPVAQRRLATRGWDFEQWQRNHQWNQRAAWRDADDWSNRDWRPQRSRQNELGEEEAEEEKEEHRHHDHGKHLGWYKHHSNTDKQGEDD
jgi:hypothetical protein